MSAAKGEPTPVPWIGLGARIEIARDGKLVDLPVACQHPADQEVVTGPVVAMDDRGPRWSGDLTHEELARALELLQVELARARPWRERRERERMSAPLTLEVS